MRSLRLVVCLVEHASGLQSYMPTKAMTTGAAVLISSGGGIARRGVESSEKLGRHRWVVERTHGWFAGFGKLRIRFEKRLDIHEALLKLAAVIICARFVDRWC